MQGQRSSSSDTKATRKSHLCSHELVSIPCESRSLLENAEREDSILDLMCQDSISQVGKTRPASSHGTQQADLMEKGTLKTQIGQP